MALINNDHHKTSSIIITINNYCYYYDDTYFKIGLTCPRPSISNLLQSVTSVITKCDNLFYYKVRTSKSEVLRDVLAQTVWELT